MYIGEPKPYEREEYIYDENLNKIIYHHPNDLLLNY